MDPFVQAISRIIKEQESIIGPVALDQAKKVSGLNFEDPNNIKIVGGKKEAMTHLVEQYKSLFGPASVEICKEAIQPFSDKIPPSEIPDILKK